MPDSTHHLPISADAICVLAPLHSALSLARMPSMRYRLRSRASDRGKKAQGGIWPWTGREGAMAAALRLCIAVRGTTVSLGDNAIRLTVSIGVASYPLHGRSPNVVLEQADRAMYTAKSCGGNTVASAE